MASGDTLVSISPDRLRPENAGNPAGNDPLPVTAGAVHALAFNPGNTAGADAVVRFPANASFSTGATFKLLIAEDSANAPNGAGGVVKLGVNCGVLGTSSAYVTPDTTVLGTEATTTVTLPSSTNAYKTIEVSIPIVVANMASAAANKHAIVRIRRLGADTADTSKSRVFLLGATILDT